MGGGRYTAKDITGLEGLDPVRKRPGMYIGGVDAAGLHHLLWEIVDNSVDEAMNGHAKHMTVTLGADGSTVTVADDGRGIPVDRHRQYGKPALELILTTLHAGGKFGGKNYSHSGGLHGVGASVVNALSESLVARVRRDGAEWEQRFARGKPTTKLKKVKAARGSGTTITFRPDSQIFSNTRFDPVRIAERLEANAYLHAGLTVDFVDAGRKTEQRFRYEDGIRAYLQKLVADSGQQVLAGEVVSITKVQQDLHLDCALAWTEDTSERVLSFVNGIPTTGGGAHENGLRGGLAKALRNYLTTHGLVPRGLQIAAEDAREGIVAVLAIKVPQPQFQGQTKERLNNAEVTPVIDAAIRVGLENALNANRTVGDAIAGRVILAARARTASRAAAQQVQRKSAVSHRLNLPGKLADCSSTNPAECELFIVEGDSAGGSAKQGRDRAYQAILPLRGKVLNTEQATAAKIAGNKELSDLVSALGCGAGKSYDATKLRYHKICLLMDADSDGHHICTLLLTFFYRHLPELIRDGFVYIAQPPLYRIEVGKRVHWARDDAAKEALLATLNGKRDSAQVTRFKGLGEMNPATLKETTLDPMGRTLLRVSIDDAPATDAAIRTLMGRDVQPRFEFITQRAAGVRELDV